MGYKRTNFSEFWIIPLVGFGQVTFHWEIYAVINRNLFFGNVECSFQAKILVDVDLFRNLFWKHLVIDSLSSNLIMTSVTGPSKPKTALPKKKNGFYVFMEERKLATEESLGFKLNMSDLSLVLSEDWKNMSADEKEGYTSKAKAYNERMRPGNEQTKLEAVKALVTKKEAEQCKENREIVWNMITEANWTSQPIVLCCFSTYFEPALVDREKYTPAEIGLTAFSLKDGVIDNFARIIDPNGTIPTSKEFEALEQVDQLGIPAIGTYDELKHYSALANIIKAFLEKNSVRGDGALHVFAFMSDLEKTRKCLDWIFEAAGCSIPIKVLNLSLYAHLASTVNSLNFRSVNEGEGAASRPISSATLFTAANRIVGDPLNKCFIYPPAHPMTCFGVFPNEACVDDTVKSSDNYKYYEELCCVYHMKNLDASHYCALNSSNRYAFALLEILTMSNEVKLIRGAHYPTLYDSDEERQRRWKLLCRWGITGLEQKMKNEDDAALEERAMKERHQRRQRRLLERQLREETQREQVEKCRQWQEAQRRITEEWRSQNEKRQEAKRLWPWATQ